MYDISINGIECKELDTIILPLFEEGLTISNEQINNKINRLKERDQFKGNFGEIYNLTVEEHNNIQDIVILGLGKEADLTKEKLRRAFGKVQKKLVNLNSKKILIKPIKIESISEEDILKIIVEGLLLASYKFDKYKSERKKEKNIFVSIEIDSTDDIRIKNYEQLLDETKVLVQSTFIARDLVNEPANIIYPETLGEKVKDLGSEYNFEVEILDEKQAEEIGMQAFISVGKGSDKKPRVIVMRYFGDKDNMDKRLALVGKGLTYDSGGYSLKNNSGMVSMKADMGGAAAVIGAISAIAKNKLKINVIAVVAACENLVSGHSYKPGDIINSMGGKTIEVLNADAEGRLTLVDAVTYAIEKEGATEIIDIATLTGSAVMALGDDVTAVITNNQDFYKELEVALESTGEKMWQMPAFDDYKDALKGELADLKNIGGSGAGSITAGLFIGEFIGNRPWLHLDIAGPAYIRSSWDYCPNGGTGAGVRTLYEVAKNKSK